MPTTHHGGVGENRGRTEEDCFCGGQIDENTVELGEQILDQGEKADEGARGSVEPVAEPAPMKFRPIDNSDAGNQLADGMADTRQMVPTEPQAANPDDGIPQKRECCR